VSFPAERPTLVLNPQDDRTFEAFVAKEIEGEGDGPEQLQVRLRGQYPRAIVRRRDLAGERTQIWYVYRDGYWVRPRPG